MSIDVELHSTMVTLERSIPLILQHTIDKIQRPVEWLTEIKYDKRLDYQN